MTDKETTYTIHESSGMTYTTTDAFTAERWALAGLRVTAETVGENDE
jgi:hypothetical protein